jgi:hypothetical protein
MNDEQKACRHANLPTARRVMMPLKGDVSCECPDCGLPFIVSTSPFAEIHLMMGPALKRRPFFSEVMC